MRNKRRRRERNGFIEILNGVLSLFVLALLAVGGVLLYGAWSFYADSNIPEGQTFQVPRGAGLQTIAERLEEEGLVSNRWIFQLGTQAQERQSDIKAGEFNIPAGSSMADILKELTEGTPITYSVTIPEGFTSWQVVERVLANESLTGDITGVPAEGTLLPQTYVFERGDAREDIIEQMKTAQTNALAEVWENRDPDIPVETPEELVTLASIVEKETGLASERPEVAGVFVNRLNRGMRLQSDPTIIYGITRGEGPLGRSLTRADIEAETPYNTYVIDRLPPGPIANPGIEAMRAVANPAETDALYFVAAGANPREGHLFAATYAEHRQNVALYRQALRDAAALEEAEAQAAREALQEEQAEAAGDETAAE